MEASTLQEALARVSNEPNSVLSLTPLPLASIFQNYKTTGSLAHHEGFLHPVGTLFTIHREYETHLSANAGEKYTQERIWNNGTHKVSAVYGGLACEKTVSLSTSHKLGSKSCMKLCYGNSSRGDSFCSLEACHNFNEEFLVSSSYVEGSSSNPTIDIQLEQEKSYYKVGGKFVKNLQSGLNHLYIQSTAALPADLTLKNSVSTNFQGDSHCSLEVAWASSNSKCILRSLLLRDGGRQVALQGGRSFWKTAHIEVSASTIYNSPMLFSVKLEHKLSKGKKISMNFTGNSDRLQEASIMVSLTQDSRSWKWKYRKEEASRHLIGLEWESAGEADGASSLSIEGGSYGIVLNGEFQKIF